MKYLMTFGYDGSNFNGFQRQKDVKNVQGTIEKELSKILNSPIIIKGSGRTDAGVHAINQCAHFEYPKVNTHKLKKELNKSFNNEIIVKSIKKVDSDFHARFSVKYKEYYYVLNCSRNKRNDKYFYTTYKNLDINKMKEAANLFIGCHDFRNFVSGKRDDYTTYIKSIKIVEKKDLIIMKFKGVGFYRYMVRHLAGSIYDVGRGKLELKELQKLIDKKVIKESSVLPAYGLYLVKIWY